jgi:hypothetical protein
MFRKKPILKYESAIEVYPNIITPSKNHVPEWYKKIPKWKDNKMFSVEDGFASTMKQCMPFMDSIMSGYMLELPYDLYVKNNNGFPFLTWRDGVLHPPMSRDDVSNINIVPFNHYNVEFGWNINCSFSVPKGYSFLFTHPLNRHDLPFTSLSGIIDGNFAIQPTGFVPFFIKKDFEGIIHKGTPILQIIPFYQENWISKLTPGLLKQGKENGARTLSLISGWYKKTFWTRKNYD